MIEDFSGRNLISCMWLWVISLQKPWGLLMISHWRLKVWCIMVVDNGVLGSPPRSLGNSMGISTFLGRPWTLKHLADPGLRYAKCSVENGTLWKSDAAPANDTMFAGVLLDFCRVSLGRAPVMNHCKPSLRMF